MSLNHGIFDPLSPEFVVESNLESLEQRKVQGLTELWHSLSNEIDELKK